MSYKIISDFKNLIMSYNFNDNTNINELLDIIDIYTHLYSKFELNDDVVKLYLPHIIYSSILLKNNNNKS